MKIIVNAIFIVLICFVVVGCANRGGAGSRTEYISLETTGYCKCGDCCGWKRNILMQPVHAYGPNKGKKKKVGITASGTKAKVGTIAADTNVFPFGTRIHIPGYGWGTVEDRGGAIKGGKIDLFFNSHKDALEWGRKTIQVKVER